MPPILLDWFDVQQQTSTLRTVHLGQKNVATFTENLVRNLRNLGLSSEKKSKWPKTG